MRLPLTLFSISITLSSPLLVPFARGADAEVEALKAQFNQLARRVQTLEAENARLKRAATVPPPAGSKVTPEIAALKERVTELETLAVSATPVVKGNAARATANAQAIETIERKLQADATETREIYR